MRTVKEILDGMNQIDFDLIASRDPVFFGRRVLGLIIKPFHEEWIDMFMNSNLTCIVAPTGHGKTNLMGIMMSLWIAQYQHNKEILIVSNTMEQSTKILDRIKDMIRDNEMLQNLIPIKQQEKTWSKTEIHLRTGCKIYCKPCNQNIRSYHVNYLLADEVAQYRDHQVFFKWIMTRVTSKMGKLVAITTFIDEMDLAHKLVGKEGEKRGFASKVYKAIDKEGNPFFPELYSKERLQEIKESIGSLAFDREYLSNTLSIEDALFPPQMVASCFNEELGFSMKEGEYTVMGIDIAVSAGATADYSVFTIVENIGRKTYIRRIERYRGMPISFQIDRIIELQNIFKCKHIYLDSSSMGETFVQELRQKGLPITPCDFSYKNRNDYLINLRRYMDEKRLVIPRKFEDSKCITMGDILYGELISFVVTKTPSGMVTYKTTSKHDDSVFSLALAIKGASSQKKFIDTFFAE